ncbi:molybdopterin molybdotransferase MoeA [Thalassotalea ganghwensis]
MVDNCNFPGLMPFQEAKAKLLTQIVSIKENELVKIADCRKRVNADVIHSPINVPAHNNSAMDGYALNAEHVENSTIAAGNVFKLVGTAMAGRPFTGELRPGECIRIMTGAVVPASANAVEMQENVTITNALVTLNQPVNLGNHIRKAGEDIALGELIFDAGHLFSNTDIGLLASLGVSEIAVKRKPKVAVFSTGDELKATNELLMPGDIYESNRHVIIAMLSTMNLDVIDFGIVPDNYEKIKQTFIKADQQADLVISSGGVSVGDADYTKSVLDELGKIEFWKVAIKPGKPVAFGRLTSSIFLGLPGNPVSAVVTFHLFAVQALKKMMGTSYPEPMQLLAETAAAVKKRAGRMDFQRGIATVTQNGTLSVTPLPNQGSGVLSSISRANCFIVLPREHEGCGTGEQVYIQLFDELLAH